MEDLITVTFCNQSASEEGRFIVCLFADTRFFERHPIFWESWGFVSKGQVTIFSGGWRVVRFSVAWIFFRVHYFLVDSNLV